MVTSADLRDDARAGLTAAGRAAHAGSDWAASYAGFTAASALGPLGTDDLASMATAAWRLGRLAEAVRVSELVFDQYARRDPALAGDRAVALALAWLTRGDRNIARSWMVRARQLITGAVPAATHGYLAYLEVCEAAVDGRTHELARWADELDVLRGELDSPAVDALALLARGRVALQQGRPDEAHEAFDAALRVADTPRLPLEWAGEVYGTVLRHTRRDAELARSAAWADAMDRWLDRTGLGGVYRGWAAHARGAVQVRAGEHRRALDSLAEAVREYRVLQPHRDTADVYEWMMMAHRGLGDPAAAEADAATATGILRLLAG